MTGSAHEDRLFEQITPYLSLGLHRTPIARSVGFGDALALYKSFEKIKSLRPDVLHGHGAKGGVVARIIGSALRAKRYRVARIYSPHGGSLHFSRSSLSGCGVFAAERLLEHLTDAIVFVCDFERQTYEAKIGVPRCAQRMIYNGINDRDFVAIPTRSDSVHFIYVGMLRDLKGPDVFIEAFARTERKVGHPLSALIIGDGPDHDRYRDMIEQRGFGRRIALLPAMPVKEAFAMSSIVVVPSRAEAMPYIVLEALAAGKSVIATRVGGIPEVLGANSDALVEPGDAEDLANVMARAVTAPDWHGATMPDRQAFKTKFSASAMADQTLTVYREHLTPH
ncbi:glycosyl transferase [Ciceribacter naphthalenivorans]|uniref:Glycosyl transferase n=3 Tax=Pseudomonadota TaxID=1224 RepID=A0A512HGW6_9HYPH|nr:glycosyl transferase [Ciceribacter naphthalenivorans]GLR22593.1 glycosyl transferase [Ciceribacter naphthalenivorans]GLT05449.1 glycosyl transferase [Sphingomonas psychrolutea]